MGFLVKLQDKGDTMEKEQLDRQAQIKLLQENFYVMRFMWKHIRGEVGDEMYSESGYNIRRNRYERILQGERGRNVPAL